MLYNVLFMSYTFLLYAHNSVELIFQWPTQAQNMVKKIIVDTVLALIDFLHPVSVSLICSQSFKFLSNLVSQLRHSNTLHIAKNT